jgi:ribonuclease BN (tRNA processing enzyme)
VSALRLTFLGTGDAWVSGGAANSAVLAEHEGKRLLVECGPTVPLALARLGLVARDLDGVLVTHRHGDHLGGLPLLLLAADAAGSPRELPILGPPGLGDQVLAVARALYPDGRLDFSFARHETLVPGAATSVAGFDVEALAVHHMDPAFVCLGYRVSRGGRCFAYTGDAGPRSDFEALARGIHLLVTECTLATSPAGKPNRGHTSVDDVRDRVVRAGAARVVLTHLSSEARQRAQDLAGVVVASDGLVVEV